jgi:hypothetical protein
MQLFSSARATMAPSFSEKQAHLSTQVPHKVQASSFIETQLM